MSKPLSPTADAILGTDQYIEKTRYQCEGPSGQLPLTAEMLGSEPSGNLFGLTQNAGMGYLARF